MAVFRLAKLGAVILAVQFAIFVSRANRSQCQYESLARPPVAARVAAICDCALRALKAYL